MSIFSTAFNHLKQIFLHTKITILVVPIAPMILCMNLNQRKNYEWSKKERHSSLSNRAHDQTDRIASICLLYCHLKCIEQCLHCGILCFVKWMCICVWHNDIDTARLFVYLLRKLNEKRKKLPLMTTKWVFASAIVTASVRYTKYTSPINCKNIKTESSFISIFTIFIML